MSIINPLLEQHVTPHLAKIMEAIQKPMTDAYDESIKYWDESVGKFEIKGPKGDLDKVRRPSPMFSNSLLELLRTRSIVQHLGGLEHLP